VEMTIWSMFPLFNTKSFTTKYPAGS